MLWSMERAFNFHDFLSKELYCEKRSQKKKTFIFECYSLIDLME
jgi:hypothetical protein